MIGTGASPVSPHGKVFYVGVGLFALLTGSMFTFGIFAPVSITLGLRLTNVGIAIIFFLGALQAIERLLRPESAHQRSIALPLSARRRVRSARKAIVGICLIGFFTAAVMGLTASGRARDAGQDIRILSGVLLFVAYCLADFCGERLSSQTAANTVNQSAQPQAQ